ncbi:MAG: hypothetical protein OXB84_03770 [Halobacteriovoraceae bacterium]|nr:hypothetical protein [Halobacteriovoraceae bacterium]
MDDIEDILQDARDCSDENKLLRHAGSSAPGVALEVAKSAHATGKVLETLADSKSLIIRHEVAKNPNTPRKCLEKMLEDSDMLVYHYARQTLAKLS